MKVVAYVRVSTKGQTEDDKFGIDAQRDSIKEYCEKNGHEIVEWYEDKGVSGAKEEREAFGRILSGDIPIGVEAVIVAKSDRVARDVYIYFAYKNELRKKNLQIISVAEDFGDQGVFTVVLDAMLAAMAEIERQNITMRTSGGRKQKAKRGGYSGGQAPYGYRVSDKSLVVNEDEAPIVKDIFTYKMSGCSSQEISDRLNNRGVPTRKGRPWTRDTVRSILSNRATYEGSYHYGDLNWVKGEHQAII